MPNNVFLEGATKFKQVMAISWKLNETELEALDRAFSVIFLAGKAEQREKDAEIARCHIHLHGPNCNDTKRVKVNGIDVPWLTCTLSEEIARAIEESK